MTTRLARRLNIRRAADRHGGIPLRSLMPPCGWHRGWRWRPPTPPASRSWSGSFRSCAARVAAARCAPARRCQRGPDRALPPLPCRGGHSAGLTANRTRCCSCGSAADRPAILGIDRWRPGQARQRPCAVVVGGVAVAAAQVRPVQPVPARHRSADGAARCGDGPASVRDDRAARRHRGPRPGPPRTAAHRCSARVRAVPGSAARPAPARLVPLPVPRTRGRCVPR